MVSSAVYGRVVSLPSADVNALAELAVTVSSLWWFHSVTVLTKNELQYCSVLLTNDRDSEASSVVDDLFHEWVFSFAAFKSGWTNSSAVFICWGQEVFWSNGWYHALSNFAEHAAVRRRCLWQFSNSGSSRSLEHLPYAASVSGLVILCDETGCLALDSLQFLNVLF